MANSRSCKILNVAEKNDAAREISKIMSGGRVQRREGYSKYNKIYEFDFNILGKRARLVIGVSGPQDAHMVMTSVSGHLLALDFILAYKNWNSCAPEVLFTADVQYYCPDDFVPIKRTLEKEVRGCQHLILWTDGDREGENIADEILQVVTQVKSRGLSVHRARFSEITLQSITSACRNLGPLNHNVSDAVKVRRELDLRIGSAFTRFQTKYLTRSFPSVLGDQLVSYGPCQFPTLGFVVERYNQIQAFVSETFYKIKVTHEKDVQKVEFSWKRGRVFNHTICLVLYQLCLEDPTAHVLGTTSRPRSKWRPLPLDTVELEKLASRKLRISAKETMKIAEKLYTQGLISYPRTETNTFPESLDLSAIIQHQGNDKKVYELVVRHFLACCSQDAKGQETKVEIDIGGEKFNAEGLMILASNYLDVYPYDKWNTKVIPVYETHTSFQPTSIEMVDGGTTAPPLLQEADLIALMEKHGIGTDATHAEHIETIKNRNYVGVQTDGGFVPGELGMGLVEGYDSMGFELSKPKLRAELETDLKRICEGTKSKEDVLSETINKYKQVFLNAKLQANRLLTSLSKFFGPSQSITQEEATPTVSEAVRKCPYCLQCNLVIRRKRDGGFMLSCLGYPQCRAVQFFPKFVVNAERHESSCSTCQPQPVHKLSLRFKEGEVPPYVDLTLVACTTCDHTIKEDLAFPPIRTTNPATSGGVNSSLRGSSATTRGRGSRTSRHTAAQRAHGSRMGGGNEGRGSRMGRGNEGRGSRMGRGNEGRGSRMGGGDVGHGSSQGNGDWRQSPTKSWQPPSPPPFSDVRQACPILGGAGNNPVTCNCGEDAILLTVRKEDSANKGRQFYKCPRPSDAGGCSFFLWADQTAPGSSSSGDSHMTSILHDQAHHNAATTGGPGMLSGRAPRGKRATNRGGGGTNGPGRGTSERVSVVVCNCGDEAAERTVQKDGPNKGKCFFTCSKPRDQQCQFFEWSSNLPANSVRNYSASRVGRGRGQGGRGRGSTGALHEENGGTARKTRAPPTCSVCREVGHTKRSCPVNKQ